MLIVYCIVTRIFLPHRILQNKEKLILKNLLLIVKFRIFTVFKKKFQDLFALKRLVI